MDITDEIKEVLHSLDKKERQIFSRILQIERSNLHIQKPKLKGDLLKAIREIIK